MCGWDHVVQGLVTLGFTLMECYAPKTSGEGVCVCVYYQVLRVPHIGGVHWDIQWNLRIADGLGPLIISVIRRLGLNGRLRIEWHSTTEPCFYCLYEPNAYLK